MKAPKTHVEIRRGISFIEITSNRFIQPWTTVTRPPSVAKLVATTAVGVVNINRTAF